MKNSIDPYEEKAIRDVARTLAELAAIELDFTTSHQLPADWFAVTETVKIDRKLESALYQQIAILHYFHPVIDVQSWWGWWS